jgi:hypothetical protein
MKGIKVINQTAGHWASLWITYKENRPTFLCPPSFGRHVKLLVPAAIAAVSIHYSALGRVGVMACSRYV